MSFSPSPIHFDVSVDAEQLKNVLRHSVAIAFASMVLPLPGGPKSKMPLEGERRPLKMSGFKAGRTMVSWRIFLTSSRPLMSCQDTFGEWSRIVSSIDLTISGSRPFGTYGWAGFCSFCAAGGVCFLSGSSIL